MLSMIEPPGRRGLGRIAAAACLAAPLAAALHHQAAAAENGLTEYPIGADSYGVAFRPPPGQGALLNYTEFYSGTIYNGSTSIGGSHVNVFVSAFRGVYTLPTTFDDGKISFTVDLVAGGGTANAKVPLPGGGRLSNGSTGLVDLNPWIEANYHDGPLFATAGLAVWVPTGTYNKDSAPIKGLGLNHYTFAPLLYMTYLASPRWQVDLASVTEFNTVNPHTEYTSGADETFTSSLSYTVIPDLQIGPTAYFYGQFSDDSQKNVTISKGDRSQALGVGAQVIYTIGHGAILAKYYHQTLVQNRAGGDQFWIQFAIPF
jgi:hypothetical protein